MIKKVKKKVENHLTGYVVLKRISAYIIIAIAVVLCEVSVRTINLVTDENDCKYPALGKCNVCEKRVFIWQNYEKINNQVLHDKDKPLIDSTLVYYRHIDCKK